MNAYSQVLSHYCLTRKLLPAVFPHWAGLLLFNQPGELRLLCVYHIEARLRADTRSTQNDHPQESRPQAIQRPQPPRNWITGVRHYARLLNCHQIWQVNRKKPRLPDGSEKPYPWRPKYITISAENSILRKETHNFLEIEVVLNAKCCLP